MQDLPPRTGIDQLELCEMAILDLVEAVWLRQVCAPRSAGNARPEMKTHCECHRSVWAPAKTCLSCRRGGQCRVAGFYESARCSAGAADEPDGGSARSSVVVKFS